MARRRHSAEQVINKLRQAEVAMAEIEHLATKADLERLRGDMLRLTLAVGDMAVMLIGSVVGIGVATLLRLG